MAFLDKEILAAEVEKVLADAEPADAPGLLVAVVARHLASNAQTAHDALERRLRSLEDARVMKFCGPFDPKRTYEPGAVVQRSSATWVAMIQTSATPGAAPDWRRIIVATE